MKLLKIGLFLLTVLLNKSEILAQNNIIEKSKLSIGEVIKVRSEILNEDRVLNIYLPLSYKEDSAKKYPVIYLLDGSIYEDFIHISGLVQFGSFSWINMVPESIVVGISNIDRKRDFTHPTTVKKDKKEFPTTGGSEDFIKFIEQELQPTIDKNFRTDTITTLIGQSLGGLLATEILFKKTDLFDNYIIISPSLWWDKMSLLNKSSVPDLSNKSIYIGVGKEGRIMERTAKSLYKKLDTTQHNNTRLYFKFFEELDHGDALHLAVYDAFNKLFRSQKEEN